MDQISLPLAFYHKQVSKYYSHVYYPYTCAIRNQHIQSQVNRQLYELASRLIYEQYNKQDTNRFADMIGYYAIKTNEKDVISAVCTNYAMMAQAAHGLTVMDSRTIDVQTGEAYTLSQLFLPDSDYETIISHHILEQIEERQIPIIQPFTRIDRDQSYYIADKCLLIYFPLYEITPYYFGFPYFPISLYTLEDLFKPDIFIQRLLANN